MSEQGADAHTLNAAEMFDVPPSEVTPEQRACAMQVKYIEYYFGGVPMFQHFMKKLEERRAKEQSNA